MSRYGNAATKARWIEIDAAALAIDDPDDRDEYLSGIACPDCGKTGSIQAHREADYCECERCACHDAIGYWPEQITPALVRANTAPKGREEGYCEECGDALDRNLECRRCDIERGLDRIDQARDEARDAS